MRDFIFLRDFIWGGGFGNSYGRGGGVGGVPQPGGGGGSQVWDPPCLIVMAWVGRSAAKNPPPVLVWVPFVPAALSCGPSLALLCYATLASTAVGVESSCRMWTGRGRGPPPPRARGDGGVGRSDVLGRGTAEWTSRGIALPDVRGCRVPAARAALRCVSSRHQVDQRNVMNAKMYVGGGGGGQK